ncbi:hypothetical protein [Actinoplanes sp. TFC3]|uniref:hypothetical protein n=1 Tax=Actinoplanes sp. TFC3 TaxID=1710355 RepID=UPI00083658D0|nr:hypothetical protein [Actinoplanes sp. TFC3]
MTTNRCLSAAAAAATVFLIGACAQNTGDSAAGSASSSSPSSPAAAPDALVLRVQQAGGFVSPDAVAGRLPAISVYADGRVIFEGPVTAIYPGPALPNVQVLAITPEQAATLAAQAVAAGVSRDTDFGQPGVADAPSTRVTAVTAAGAQSVEAMALNESRADDPQLSDAQKQARSKLKAFLDGLDKLTSGQPVPYEPEAMAAIASVYHDPGDTSIQKPDTVQWPGPALPGEALGAQLTCVVFSGDQLEKVRAAAAKANAATPWMSGSGAFTLRMRPLLPDESSCADLKANR